jgi:outer membrane phospholipase A
MEKRSFSLGTELFYMQDLNVKIGPYLRPWFRMPAAIDDNPDISEYIGRET